MTNLVQNKNEKIKKVYDSTLLKIKKIKKDRDQKIRKTLENINKRQIDKIRNNINNLK